MARNGHVPCSMDSRSCISNYYVGCVDGILHSVGNVGGDVI